MDYIADRIGRSFLHIGQMLLYIMASSVLFGVSAFFVGKSVTWYLLPLSFLAGLLLLLLFYGEPAGPSIIYESAAAILLFLFLTYLAGKFVDQSYDGNTYHKLAVGLLRYHWNPFLSKPSLSFIEQNLKDIPDLWIESYCKGTWIFAAGIYAMTGSIECGKVYTMLGMLCCFLVSVSFLFRLGKKPVFTLLFSLAAALNPVSVAQFDTFYVDGFLASTLELVVFSLIMLNLKPEAGRRRLSDLSILTAAMILCGNTKFTGLLYGGIFCAANWLWRSAVRLRIGHPHAVSSCLKSAAAYALLAAVTIFWAGSPTYLTNFFRHGTFTYPLTGSGSVDIMSANSPFSSGNRFHNLFYSLFSRMDNFLQSDGKTPELKIPFTTDWETERWFLDQCDIRISGFGIFFGGLILLAVVFLVIGLIRMKKGEGFTLLLCNLAVCVGLALLIRESWYARYAPYLFFLLLAAVYLSCCDRSLLLRFSGMLLAAAVITNSCFFFYWTSDNLRQSDTIRSQIDALRTHGHVAVWDPVFFGGYFNLKDQDVHYTIYPDLADDPDAAPLGYLNLVWKADQ